MFEFHALGMNYRHDKDFGISRPEGSGDNLLLIFKTSAVVDEQTVPPESFILYGKGHPQRYRADGGIYINHWLHMDCCENDIFHTKTELPFNTVLTAADLSSAEKIMTDISRESMSDSAKKNEYIDLLIRMLLMKLGEAAHGEGGGGMRKSVHYSALHALRAEIYSSAGMFGSVAELAARLNLSPSHFQQLYREQFGISCYEDVICAKIKTAKHCLKTTDMTVKEIASICGYENDVHFMRQFKLRTGMTPTDYRCSEKI